MEEREDAIRLAGLEEKISSMLGRLSRLEKAQTALNRLATAIEVMATRQESMRDSLERLDEKVSALEAKPAKRWEALGDKVLCAVAGAVMAWVMAGMPAIG